MSRSSIVPFSDTTQFIGCAIDGADLLIPSVLEDRRDTRECVGEKIIPTRAKRRTNEVFMTLSTKRRRAGCKTVSYLQLHRNWQQAPCYEIGALFNNSSTSINSFRSTKNTRDTILAPAKMNKAIRSPAITTKYFRCTMLEATGL